MYRKERKVKNARNAILVDFDDKFEKENHNSTKWSMHAKLISKRYNTKFARSYKDGINFSKRNFEIDGFSTPILFLNQEGLGLSLPFVGFGVNDVEDNVGKDRVLDVVDVDTQDAIGMTMREWCRYFNKPKKERLLNVISLEYSQTKMDYIVKAPDVVLEIDWLESCWPQNSRDISVDNKSYLKNLTYPKVRKYCLMSVKGCYTDFHIDLGGTSVWYHIFKGEKIFWMVPPTEANLSMFEQWSISIDQPSNFFPDLVEDCEKVHLKQGNTFMIPSGWIHGVYTPVDSLVFGGNFLHSFGIDKQLRIYDLEERIKVSAKYRYPFFVEMHWYVLATFIAKLNGKCYLKKMVKKEPKVEKRSRKLLPENSLNQYELVGLYGIYRWLSHLPQALKKLVPKEIIDPAVLLHDAECVIKTLPLVSSDSQELQPSISQLIEFQNGSNLSEPSTNQENIHKSDKARLSPPKLLDPDIKPLPRPTSTHTHKRTKRARLVHPLLAETPLDMFSKITHRVGSRVIQRPERLIEQFYK